MPIELLERIKTLPEGYEQEIVDFLESILLKAAQDHRASSSRRIGIAKGELKYPDDIDFERRRKVIRKSKSHYQRLAKRNLFQ